jgi:M6 family metalloprotease-like protein
MKLAQAIFLLALFPAAARAAGDVDPLAAPPAPALTIDHAIFARPAEKLAAPRRFRLAVVPVEFKDRHHDARFTTADLEALLFSRGTYTKTSPTGERVFGSAADYYAENSSGRLKLEGRVFDWIALGRERGSFEKPGALSQALSYARFFIPALYALEKREGPGVLDGFDGVSFVIAGEYGPTKTVFWPHSAAIPWRGRLLRYYLMSEQEHGRFAAIGVHCHEFGHVLGILDKYGSGGHAGLGIWCLMAIGGRGDRENGERRPLHLCAWCKEQLGWLAPATVDPRTAQTLRLRGIEGHDGEALKVLVDPSGSEYFLLENRRRAGFDGGIPRPGLLIWHVGEPFQRLRNGVYAYDIDLEEAHGDETRAGPFKDLDRIPWPIPGKDAFTPWSRPGSTSWNPRALEVAITHIREEGEDVVFTIGDKVPPP